MLRPRETTIKRPFGRGLERPGFETERPQFGPLRPGYASPSGVEADEPTMLGAISTVLGTMAEDFIEQGTYGLIYPEDIVSEKKERLYEPYAKIGHFTGEIAGTIASFIGTEIVLSVIPVVGPLLGAMYAKSKVGTLGARFVYGGLRGGTIAGTTFFNKELVRQVKEKDPNIPQLAEKTLEAFGLFGLTAGVQVGAMFSPRIVRSLAGGISLSSATTMIKLAKGEDVNKEDAVRDFIIGSLFDFVLSRRYPKPDAKKEATKNALWFEGWLKEQNWDKISKEEADKKVVAGIRSILGKTDDDFITVMKKSIGLYQQTIKESASVQRSRLFDPKEVNKSVPNWLIKSTNKQKKTLAALTKKIPELERAQIKGVKGSKAQRKMYEQLIEDTFGKEAVSSKDLSIREMDFFLKGMNEYVDGVQKGLTEMFGRVRAPGILKYVTGSDRYLFTLGMDEVLAPGILGKSLAEAELHGLASYFGYLEHRLLALDNIGAMSQLRGVVTKKGKMIDSLRRMMKWLDDDNLDLSTLPSDAHREIFGSFRRFYDVMLLRINSYNRYFGIKEIKGIKGYQRRKYQLLLDPQKASLEMSGRVSVYDKGGRVTKTEGRISPEITRKVKETPLEKLVASPAELALDMARHDFKRIFMRAPRTEIHRLLQHFKDEIPTATGRYAAEYFNRVLLGHMGDRTQTIDASIRKLGTLPAIKQIAKTMEKIFGRDLGASPTHTLSRGYGRTLNLAWIGFRPDLGIRNHTQKGLLFGLYGERAVIKSMNPYQTKHAKDTILNHPFWKRSSTAPIESVSGEISKVEKAGRYFMGSSHKSNVWFSMLTAYHSAVDLITNPKHWKLGWADPQRIAGKKLPAGKLFFESEMKKINLEIWAGGRMTQFDYTAVGRAPIHWSPEGRAVFKFWTWPLNYTFVFWREMLHRGLRNSPSWDSTGKVKLTPRMQVGAVMHVAYSSAMMSAFAKIGIDMSAIGIGYKSTLLTEGAGGFPSVNLGPMPEQGTHLLAMANASWKLIAGGSPYEMKKASNTLGYYLNIPAYLPGASFARKIQKGKKEGLKGVLFRTIKKKKIKLAPKTPSKTLPKKSERGIPLFRPLWRD